MAFNRGKFLIEVLGPDGALALAKAAKRSEYLAQMVVPRTILAWLEAYPEYSGNVPGSDFAMKFVKSEDGFSGSISMEEGDYQFQQASIFHVAGALATAMRLDSLIFGNARNSELQRLGKSIDVMAKVRLLSLAKREILGREESSPGDEHGEHSRQEILQNDEHSKDELKKKAPHEGGTGTTAGPVAPAAPAAPTASAPPATTKQNLPKKPASSMGAKPAKPLANTLKLTRSEVLRSCPMCGQRQFDDGKFVGCACFAALSKSAKALFHADETCDLTLGEGWDRATVLTLLEAFGRK